MSGQKTWSGGWQGRWLGSALRAGAVVGALVATWPAVAAGKAKPKSWPLILWPAVGPARVIGSYGGACIAGAVPLPLQGPGYQAVSVSLRRYYGHPTLINFIEDLGRIAVERNLGLLAISDLAQPRGGPMGSGHVSHQGGLDVDIWFRLDLPPLPVKKREKLEFPSVVNPHTGKPDPERWTQRHAELVHAAAMDPRVSRIFVGAAIKRDLCERDWIDRGWLRLVRPWPGHDDHLHARLHCPADSPACVGQPPLPAGEGCGETELVAALAHERAFASRPPPVPARVLPPACAELLKRADNKPDSDAANLAGKSEPAAAAPTNTAPVTAPVITAP
ncbi:MAG TPA: penicillin-insensitive murein endopeptidase [Polyangia bacterium]